MISLSKDLENPDLFREWQAANPDSVFRILVQEKTLPQCGMLATFYVEDDDVKYRFAPIRSFSSEIEYSVFDKSKFELINKSTDIPVELFQPFGMFHLRFGMWKKGYATGKCFVVDSYDRSIKPFGIDYES